MPDSLKKRSSFPTNRITDLGLGYIETGYIYYIRNRRIIYSDYMSLINDRDRYGIDSFSARYYDDRIMPIKWIASKFSDIKIKNSICDGNNSLKIINNIRK